MREVKKVSVADIDRDPDQPRRAFDEAELLALGQNMQAVGQQVPVILYETPGAGGGAKRLTLLDGERRWRAARLAGIKELLAMVLAERPTEAQLHILQNGLEAHKVGLTAMERSDLLARIQRENGWSVTDLAANLQMKQPVVSKLLAFQRLDPALKAKLHDGSLDTEKAFIVSQAGIGDQVELGREAAGLTREQLRRRVKGTPQPAGAKATAARFAMPGGMTLAVQGNDLTLACVVEVLAEAVRLLRKGLGQGMTLETQARVMRDQAKQKPRSAAA